MTLYWIAFLEKIFFFVHFLWVTQSVSYFAHTFIQPMEYKNLQKVDEKEFSKDLQQQIKSFFISLRLYAVL